jgi:hypothetical protein
MDRAEMRALIERVQNRKRYSRFDREILAGIADADLVVAIHDFILDHLLADAANAWEAFEQLRPGLRAIRATQELDGQVCNGGFAQFFWNAGRYAPEAYEALARIGAPRRRALLQQAMDLFIPAMPNFHALRNKAELAAFDTFAASLDFSPLDSAYYQLNAVEKLETIQISYIRSHIDEFVIG